MKEVAARALSWQEPQEAAPPTSRNDPPTPPLFNLGLLGSSGSWLHVSKATKSPISPTLAGELYFPEINRHRGERNGCRPKQTVAWVPKGNWWMGPVVLVQMLSEDKPKEGGHPPGKAERPMGEMFRIEDNLS